MAYTNADDIIGVPDVSTVSTAGVLGAPWISTTNDLPSVTCNIQLGSRLRARDLTLGDAEFILLQIPTSTTVTVGLLYQWDKNYAITIVPVKGTAQKTAVPVCVAYTAATSNSTSIQYAWFLVSGQVAVLKTAVAATPQSAVYISGTAGRVYFTASAGGAILGARTAVSATVSAGQSTVNVYFNNSSLEGA